jgi:hypothetical protein
MLAAIPLLSIPVLVYNILVLTMAGGVRTTEAARQLSAELLQIPMASGARLSVSLADLVLAGALVILFIELLKSTTSQKAAIINHALSMLLFVTCLVEFLLLPGFATSTFLLLTVMVSLDVLAGFIVTIVSARRDVDFDAGQN